MKVLQINAVNKIASTGRTCFEMSEYFNASGHTYVVAFSKGPLVNVDREYVIGSSLDVKFHALMSRISGKQAYFSHCATKKLLKFIYNYKADVVVLDNLHGNYINLPMLLKYLAKNDIPTVAVLHDCWFYTGKCCHYTEQGCFKWKETCGNCPQLKKYNKSWFFDRTTKLHKDKIKLFGNIPRLAVVGVSDWVLNEAKQASAFKNAKVFKRIYNWIDTDVFYPRNDDNLRNELGLEDKKVILSVANIWSKEKGLDTAIELASQLKADEQYILVGNVGDVKLPQNIIHISATNSVEELARYYSLADVFVQPSLEETFGKVSAEALACGTPVVCFDSTANPEIVVEGCGAVVKVGNVDDMFLKIKTILQNGKSTYSEKCRDFAVKNFNKQNKLVEYLNLFYKILGDR